MLVPSMLRHFVLSVMAAVGAYRDRAVIEVPCFVMEHDVALEIFNARECRVAYYAAWGGLSCGAC